MRLHDCGHSTRAVGFARSEGFTENCVLRSGFPNATGHACALNKPESSLEAQLLKTTAASFSEV